jgi:hypothetical protein
MQLEEVIVRVSIAGVMRGVGDVVAVVAVGGVGGEVRRRVVTVVGVFPDIGNVGLVVDCWYLVGGLRRGRFRVFSVSMRVSAVHLWCDSGRDVAAQSPGHVGVVG